jgi:hypothetical protein
MAARGYARAISAAGQLRHPRGYVFWAQRVEILAPNLAAWDNICGVAALLEANRSRLPPCQARPRCHFVIS